MDKKELLKSACDKLSFKTANETDLIANLSNATAILNEFMHDINWVGFYLFKKDELVLGPFQGKAACVRLKPLKGVCGTAFSNDEILIVPDVHKFQGHVACDESSNSEIVIPLHFGEKIVGVLDIDSPIFDRFDTDDRDGLIPFAKILELSCNWNFK